MVRFCVRASMYACVTEVLHSEFFNIHRSSVLIAQTPSIGLRHPSKVPEGDVGVCGLWRCLVTVRRLVHVKLLPFRCSFCVVHATLYQFT